MTAAAPFDLKHVGTVGCATWVPMICRGARMARVAFLTYV